MQEYQDRSNRLLQRLKGHHFAPQQRKSRFKTIQQLAHNFHTFLQELGQTKQDKFDYFYERLNKIQHILQGQVAKRQRKQQALSTRLTKLDRTFKKNIQLFIKQRAQSQNKLNQLVQRCKEQSVCSVKKGVQGSQYYLKQMKQLFPILDQLKGQVQNDIVITRQILKKLFQQFNQQIILLRSQIQVQHRQRQAQEEAIISRLQQVYTTIHGSCTLTKKTRERSQAMLVQLLQKVIEKVKQQLCDA